MYLSNDTDSGSTVGIGSVFRPHSGRASAGDHRVHSASSRMTRPPQHTLHPRQPNWSLGLRSPRPRVVPVRRHQTRWLDRRDRLRLG
jgi:hypothetical protein